jgi:methyl-accepting chemotaxis protein
MRFSRRYPLALLLPPLVVAFPVAAAFLSRVLRLSASETVRYSLMVFAAYAIGAGLVAFPLRAAARRVEDDVAANHDPSESVSRALTSTPLWAALLWIAWGFALSMTACALRNPTLLRVQYFAEAAMLIAGPAMAWSYWTGKHMLVSAAAGARHLAYTGRTWSIGVKIALVFIGFFIVSAGAMVLVISAWVSARLGEAAAVEIARFGIGVAFVTAIVFGIATWFLARDVTGAARQLMSIAEEMAEGRFTNEERVFADDEIGQLARSFGVTRRNLRALLASVGGRGEVITSGVRMMTDGTDTLVDGAREQSGMAVESTSALTKVKDEARLVLGEVDRVSDATSDSAERATELRASFSEVARRMDELFHSVEKSSSAATEIDASARETAGRTSNLAGIASDVLAFVSEMDATVEQIMRTAQTTAELSEQVRENANAGKRAVEATVDGIRNAQDATRRTAGAFGSLQGSLGKIDQILLFIDEVTNKTNLLSLNAAIIAAHAGTHDYGFSVIAEEVRQLADRTRTATKEIAGIIRGVQPVTNEAVTALEAGVVNVDKTVDLAAHASSALATIIDSADRSLEATQSISHSLEEQARASRHLHKVTAGMSENIQEMQRATEGQAVATRMLATEAERVSDIALQVKRATDEQTISGDGIASAMEQIANDVRSIRDRLDRQLGQAEQIATASRVTLTIAEKNNSIAEQFRTSLQSLLSSGKEFEAEVARFRA